MFAIPGIIGLVFLIYVRPQEYFGPLRAVPFLYLWFGLWLLGLVIDLRIGNVRWRKTPQLWLVLGFFAYASTTALVHGPGNAAKAVTTLAVCMALYLGIAHAVQSFRALELVSAAVLAVVLFVCGVGAEQGFAPYGCVVIDESSPTDTASGKFDGRPCETSRTCYQGDAEPEAEYMCERIGLFGTTSIGQGRVRYRGTLQDPNELALAGGAGLPLAFALGRRKRSVKHGLLVALTLALVGVCAVLTASRGGQLVFLAVLGVFFVKRFGFGGLAVGGLLALPLLVLGGRGGEEAASSTVERIDCWAEALSMWRSHPFAGVGLGRFNEYHYMTAHNSYLLTLAELGLPGMLLFTAILYLSAKIPVEVLRRFPRPRRGEPDDEAEVARRWAMAYLAAFAGLAVGIFFLSFSYHYVLWIYLGLSGALYSAVRSHAPWFRVRLRALDLLAIGLIDTLVIVLVFVYTHLALA
jgi:O-antigen ligase